MAEGVGAVRSEPLSGIRSVRNAALGVAVYFFVFQPPILQRAQYFVIELGIFLLLLVVFSKRVLTAFVQFRYEFGLLFGIFLYCLLRDLVSQDIVYLDRAGSVLLQCFAFPLALISVLVNRHSEPLLLPSRVRVLRAVILVAALSSLVLVLLPEVRGVYDSLIVRGESEDISARFLRGVGVGENLTFSFPYVVGILAAILIVSPLRVATIVWLPVLLFSITINARIAFVPILFALLYRVISVPISLIPFGILLAASVYLFNAVELGDEAGIVIAWVTSIFSDVYLLLTGNASEISAGSTLRVLYEQHIVVPPDTLSTLFGTGVNIFEESAGFGTSDIGFITQLNYGGIAFMLLLGALYCMMVHRISSVLSGNRFLVILFAGSLVVLNMKGSVFTSIPVTRLFSAAYIYLIFVTSIIPENRYPTVAGVLRQPRRHT